MSPFLLFFFNDTATTEIYTLSLHDALPISKCMVPFIIIEMAEVRIKYFRCSLILLFKIDRKSTRLNSSHANISYAVFCLKKNKNGLRLLHLQSIRLNFQPLQDSCNPHL